MAPGLLAKKTTYRIIVPHKITRQRKKDNLATTHRIIYKFNIQVLDMKEDSLNITFCQNKNVKKIPD